jgi:Tol biopolymer transport system component
VFASGATNFFAGDSNGVSDVFLRDRQLGTTERLGTGGSWAAISPDARFVAFASPDALVPGDANGLEDVFVLDRQLGTTDRVSVSTAGVEGNQSSSFPAMSPDGRYVAFQSSASSLVAGDTNGRADVFVRDRLLGTTERVSVGPGGAQAADASFPLRSRTTDGSWRSTAPPRTSSPPTATPSRTSSCATGRPRRRFARA